MGIHFNPPLHPNMVRTLRSSLTKAPVIAGTESLGHQHHDGSGDHHSSDEFGRAIHDLFDNALSSGSTPTSRCSSPSSTFSNSSAVYYPSQESEHHGSLLEQDADLDKLLRKYGCYESDAGMELRGNILQSLNLLVNGWIKKLILRKRSDVHTHDGIYGRVVTYGSYLMGTSHQGADIDALFVAPEYVSRSDCFGDFYDHLSKQSHITELRKIEEAYVPVIKFKYYLVEIDMTFVQLRRKVVPKDEPLILDDINLHELDAKSILSLNGYRSNQEIMRLVGNTESFRLALRAIRLWAKSQGIYSNVIGYLGGFSWTILVARTMQTLEEGASASEVVYKFFDLFGQWKWPNPVMLKPLEFGAGVHALQSWNPNINAHEKYQVMPIITPTFPHLNSTFNVNATTSKLIQDKMRKALKICTSILEGTEVWDALFKTCHIFHEYEHFLVVVAKASDHLNWFGLVESKMRYLVSSLEKEFSNTLTTARIWPKPYVRYNPKEGVKNQLWFVGLEFSANVLIDIKRPFQSFRETLNRQAQGFLRRDMTIEATYIPKNQLKDILNAEEIEEIVSRQSPTAMIDESGVEECDSQSSKSEEPRESKSPPPVCRTPAPQQQQQVTRIRPTPKARTIPSCPSQSKMPVPNLPNVPTLSAASTPPSSHLHQANAIRSAAVYQQHYYHQAPPHCGPPAQRYSGHMNPHDFQFVYGFPGHHGGPHQVASSYYAAEPTQPPIMERCWNSPPPQSHLKARPVYVEHHMTPQTRKDSSPAGSLSELEPIGYGSTGGTDGLDHSYASSMDSDMGRSVSFSSDKFPPQALTTARLKHAINMIPPSAFSPPTNWSGTTPPPDTSVPPPPSPSSPVFTMAHAHGRTTFAAIVTKSNGAPQSQRLSSSEIRDATTPRPVQRNYPTGIRLNLTRKEPKRKGSANRINSSSSDSVFI